MGVLDVLRKLGVFGSGTYPETDTSAKDSPDKIQVDGNNVAGEVVEPVQEPEPTQEPEPMSEPQPEDQ